MNSSEISPLVLQRALSGDNLAWDSLFERLWPVVAGVIASKVRPWADTALIEDIAQNVFSHLAESDAGRLRRFDPTRGALESYVARIAHNCTVDYLRANAQHLRNVDLSALPEAVAETESPLPMLEEWEMVAALNTLTPREREVVDLLFKRNLDTGEAAERMGVSPETVRSAKSHALGKLRKFFGQE